MRVVKKEIIDREIRLVELSNIFYTLMQEMNHCQKATGLKGSTIIPVKTICKYAYNDRSLNDLLFASNIIFDTKTSHTFKFSELDDCIFKLVKTSKNEKIFVSIFLAMIIILLFTLTPGYMQ